MLYKQGRAERGGGGKIINYLFTLTKFLRCGCHYMVLKHTHPRILGKQILVSNFREYTPFPSVMALIHPCIQDYCIK